MKVPFSRLLIAGLLAAMLANPQATAASEIATRKVAILVFDKVENIDFTGPAQVFHVAGYETFTVAAAAAPVQASAGLTVVPRYTFANAPHADVLVVPGGDVDDTMMDSATLSWIEQEAARSQHVMSVCNGAFVLTHAGLLDGLPATTTRGNVAALKHHSPAVHVVRDQRVVDTGRIITTGGFSAGIDGALHVVARLEGDAKARYVAQMLEYDWRPDAGYRPGTEALRHLPMFLDQKLGAFAKVHKIIESSGDADHWTISFLLGTEQLRTSTLKQIASLLSSYGNWGEPNLRLDAAHWTFRDDEGRPWTSSARLDSAGHMAGETVLTISLRAK
ncbi:DJ-1/PfpI family protein [Lysobacter sp.]|uniref:DJ-1/PfpI family protein n=1 Tax=Lysobacter sp. TaxID=72226 RepID=UPI002D314821|nr:DJ-1/PfpI family protein [Lysobacter sp.]HZX78173.1 DJ-1/PfpI family protein [Lysobacter sp.]